MDKHLMHAPLCRFGLELPDLLRDFLQGGHEHVMAAAIQLDLFVAFFFVHDSSLDHSISTAMATASPPPRHKDAIPFFRPWSLSAWISVVSTRAPLAPRGCPRAIAPPLTFTFFQSQP